jgi:non-ribosomal peptide synthetase component F
MLIVLRLIIERQESLKLLVGFWKGAAKPQYRKGGVVRLQQNIGTIAVARNREQVFSNAFRAFELTERSVIEP